LSFILENAADNSKINVVKHRCLVITLMKVTFSICKVNGYLGFFSL
jgi:hypothetical protein